MKPGNLLFFKVPNPAATRDEDSIFTHIGSFGVRYFFVKEMIYYGKEIIYF